MKRPRHDLTWSGIRRRWAFPKEKANNINVNGSIRNYKYKSPSAPLLINKFESLSNNVINIEGASFQSIDEHEHQQLRQQNSDSKSEYTLSPMAAQLRTSNHYENLTKLPHTCDIEMIRSELRVIVSHLSLLTREARRQAEEEDVSQDWKFVAMVVDRLCLILFTTSMTLFTALTLFSSPNFFKLQ